MLQTAENNHTVMFILSCSSKGDAESAPVVLQSLSRETVSPETTDRKPFVITSHQCFTSRSLSVTEQSSSKPWNHRPTAIGYHFRAVFHFLHVALLCVYRPILLKSGLLRADLNVPLCCVTPEIADYLLSINSLYNEFITCVNCLSYFLSRKHVQLTQFVRSNIQKLAINHSLFD